MHRGNQNPTRPELGASGDEKSLENPKPDPHDTTISALKYESDLKQYKAVEKLAVHEQNEWIYYTTHILRVLDEFSIILMEASQELPHNTKLKADISTVLRKQQERDQRWELGRCSFSKLPFDLKEQFRFQGRRAYEAMHK